MVDEDNSSVEFQNELGRVGSLDSNLSSYEWWKGKQSTSQYLISLILLKVYVYAVILVSAGITQVARWPSSRRAQYSLSLSYSYNIHN